MFKTLQWEDWVGIALGAWMLVSPWVLGYSDNGVATMNALILGTILVLEEMLDLGVHEMAEEGIDLIAGFWLVVSPMVLGFASLTPASANAMAVGVLTMLFAFWAMSDLDQSIGRCWWHDHVTGH
jgi:hypothetical protein